MRMGRRARLTDGAMVRTAWNADLWPVLPVGAGTAARRAAGGSLPSALTGGGRHRARSAANGVCHSNVRITPNAGIPAEKGPPRNWRSFPPPALGGLCRPEAGVPSRSRAPFRRAGRGFAALRAACRPPALPPSAMCGSAVAQPNRSECVPALTSVSASFSCCQIRSQSAAMWHSHAPDQSPARR